MDSLLITQKPIYKEKESLGPDPIVVEDSSVGGVEESTGSSLAGFEVKYSIMISSDN